jgi:predicted flavoprotein YhiN
VRARAEGRPDARLTVQWTPLPASAWEDRFRASGSRTALNLVRSALPGRLAERLVALAGVAPERTLPQLRKEERHALVSALARFELPWTGDEGYHKAEVTGGGVSLAEINPRTMQSRLHAGLFLCGEVLDAFGPIGGYNFLWAWVTGRAAGLGAAAPANGPVTQ